MTAPGVRRNGRRTHRSVPGTSGALLGVAVAVACGLVTWRTGALGLPKGDDWVYLRALDLMASERRFVADPYAQTMLVGQLVATLPFARLVGFDLTALNLAMIAVSGLAVTLTHRWCRRLLRPGLAWVPPLVLGLGPLWGFLAGSFMTDVPAYTLQVLALLLVGTGLRDGRVHWPRLVGAGVVSLWAFTIREFAVAVPLAVALVVVTRLVSLPGRDRRLLLLGVGGLGLVQVAALAWRRGLTDSLVPYIAAKPVPVLVASTALTLGVMCAPALVAALAGPLRELPRRRGPTLASLTIAGLCVWQARRIDFLVGNGFDRSVVLEPLRLLGLPEALGRPVWWGLIVLGALGLALLLHLALTSLGSRVRVRADAAASATPVDPTVALTAAFVAVVGVLAVCVPLVSGLSFDRYTLPAVPFTCALVLRWADGQGRRTVVVLATAATAAWALVGIGQVGMKQSLNALWWAAGTETAAAGYAPETIHASHEWYGYHQRQPIVVGRPRPPYPGIVAVFAEPRICAIVAGEPGLGTGRPIVTVTSRSLFGTPLTATVVAADLDC